MRMNQLSRMWMMLLFTGVFSISFFNAQAQKISTSPSRLNYKVSPGGTQRGIITVANNSDIRQDFNVDFGDFDASRSGKSKFLEKGVLPRSCANWLSATPSLFTLDPGETQQVEVVMDVPQDSLAYMARWAVAYIRLAGERQAQQQGNDGLIVNLNQSYRFGVYIFQTPPSATYAKGEVTGFAQEDDMLVFSLKNTGETFLVCNSYLEFTNLQNGEMNRINSKQFTVLPASDRDVTFRVPSDLPAGKYSVLGVLDYGSRDEVEAAEIEITIPERSKQK
ncbi:P pilus assembly chaperone PapD [Roseivirga pacifica]|uniref:P pilus assembly protein, chaperone PapD n=2 Tax=Roseivirga pacifica TaxID=1267423 RepID=A0A1I0M6L6_9BACT|nr:P pilus assembly chaperone PapD [Roseivirga pacifica]SEV83983.1 P pilus assembly protein, chaperone PapD [Roseivirga pacifica]